MDFPLELIYRIGTYLCPRDVIRLAYTCKSYYHLLLPQIYAAVKIDSSRQPYTAVEESLTRYITIKSLHSFRLFMKNLMLNPEYCSYVRWLQFMDEIPDVPEIELLFILNQVIPQLTRLQGFEWYTIQTYVPCQLVAKLPNLAHMKTLVGNMKHFEHIHSFAGNFEFYGMEDLLISGFGPHSNLKKLELSRFTSLNKLTVSKNSLTKALKGGQLNCVSNFIELPEPNVDDANYISQLGMAPLLPWLTEFVLKDICLSAADGNRLSHIVPLDNLTSLKIINCTEKFEGGDRFLDTLRPQMHQLSTLTLSLSNEANDNGSIVRFISQLPHKLKQLELQIRCSPPYRESKLGEIVQAITTHKNTLTYLDFDFETVRQYKDQSFKYAVTLQEISQLSNLKYLRIPINQYEVCELVHVVSNLTRLKFLQLALKDFKTPIINNNTLISQEYFDYPNSVTLNYHNTIVDQLANVCRDFKSFLSVLRYLVFEAAETYFFNCCCHVIQESGLDLVFKDIVERESI